MTEFTICYHMYHTQHRFYDRPIVYAVPNHDNEICMWYTYEENKITMDCADGKLVLTWMCPQQVELYTWYSFCFAVDIKARKWEAVMNGKIMEHEIDVNKDPELIRGGGLLMIGIDQDTFGGGFAEHETIRGILADFSIYDKKLSTDTIINFSLCNDDENLKNPVVNYKNIRTEYKNIGVEIEEYNDKYVFCTEDTSYDIIIAETLTYEQSDLLCQTLGSRMSIPSDKEYNDRFYQQGLLYVETCDMNRDDMIWLGIKGNVENKIWYNDEYDTEVNYTNFDQNDDIFWDEDNMCVTISGNRGFGEYEPGIWHQTDCGDDYCVACHFPSIQYLKVRGLCETSLFDKKFLIREANGSVTFVGLYYSIIELVPIIGGSDGYGHGFWKMYRFDMPNVNAVLERRSPTHYPTGMNVWAVEDDECGFDDMPLIITSCGEGMFSCDDGTCRDRDDRCDTEFHCPEGTDELDCDPIILSPLYDSESLPPRPGPHTPLEIMVHITILTIRSFQIEKFKFTCEIEMELSWKDERIDYKNLQVDALLNNININKQQPWLPEVEIISDSIVFTRTQQNLFEVHVNRISDPLPDNDINYREDELFSSSKNLMVMNQQLTVDTKCQFNLFAFPFDIQTCAMVVMLKGQMKKFLTLVPDKHGGVEFVGNKKLREYSLDEVTMVPFEKYNYTGLAIQMRFFNLFTFYVSNTYLPTFILLIIGYLTFLFPLNDFNDRIMVALTSLLVEAALFTQVSNSVPKTAYLKLIDVWFIFIIVFLFLIVIALVYINWLLHQQPVEYGDGSISPTYTLSKPDINEDAQISNDNKWDLESKKNSSLHHATALNKICILVIPVLTCAFGVVYFIVGVLIE